MKETKNFVTSRTFTNVIINNDLLNQCKFTSKLTYRMLFYIIANYDFTMNKVRLCKNEFINYYGCSYHTFNAALDDLINNNILKLSKTEWFEVNDEILKFI